MCFVVGRITFYLAMEVDNPCEKKIKLSLTCKKVIGWIISANKDMLFRRIRWGSGVNYGDWDTYRIISREIKDFEHDTLS